MCSAIYFKGYYQEDFFPKKLKILDTTQALKNYNPAQIPALRKRLWVTQIFESGT